MKKNLLPLILLFLIGSAYQTQAQSKVSSKELMGNWKLIIDLDEEFEKAKEDMEDEDSFIGEIVLSSVSGLVSGVLDQIEIYMDFQPDGEVRVIVEAFGEREIEYSEWSIDKKGRLFISDTKSFSTDDSDYWLMEDGVLLLFEDDDRRTENVYMVNLDEK